MAQSRLHNRWLPTGTAAGARAGGFLCCAWGCAFALLTARCAWSCAWAWGCAFARSYPGHRYKHFVVGRRVRQELIPILLPKFHFVEQGLHVAGDRSLLPAFVGQVVVYVVEGLTHLHRVPDKEKNFGYQSELGFRHSDHVLLPAPQFLLQEHPALQVGLPFHLLLIELRHQADRRLITHCAKWCRSGCGRLLFLV